MRFEGNTAIPETQQEEELIVKGKKNKEVKLYSAYIYRVLLEESSVSNTFKVKELCKRILERFKVYIEISTIQDYIKSIDTMNGLSIQGNPYNGYYLENQNGDMYVPFEYLLDDTEINMLIQTIKHSRIPSVGSKKSIINKLKYFASDSLKQLLSKQKHITKEEKHNHLKDLFSEDMIDVVTEQRPIMLQLKKEHKYLEFHTYAVLSHLDTYILVGRYKDAKIARFISLGTIEDYRVIESKRFTKVKVPIKYSTFFTSDECLEILKSDCPNDFIFPTQSEILLAKRKLFREHIERERKEVNLDDKN